MNYKKSYIPTIGYTPICDVEKDDCSLKKLNFGIVELKKNDFVVFETGDKEWAFIILGGNADFSFDDKCWKGIGSRRNVFENMKATALYFPRNKSIKITGCNHVKIAVCGTKTDVDTEAQIITPDNVRTVKLGVKPWERVSSFIIDGETNSKYLTVGEGYITPGNWAGFPPHKHDEDNMPSEGVLEEIYYYLFLPEQGFAIQRMYTKDGEIDETYTVKQDDLVEFPKGYHTTVGAPGYNAYFLWMMAGEHQGFFRSNDPDHDWVTAVENIIKKQ